MLRVLLALTFASTIIMSSFGKKVTLKYFPIEAAAEKVRLALHVSGVAFEDIRVPFGEWQEMKATMPNGQLPVMTIDDGEMITQSGAMARWAARQGKGELYPVDDVEKCLLIDMLIGYFEDDSRDWSPALYMGMNPAKFGYDKDFAKTDAGKDMVKSMREKYVKEILPKNIGLLIKQLKKSGGPFLCGDSLSLADVWWIPRLKYLRAGIADHLDKTCLDSMPEILAYIDAVYAHPSIASWYAKKA